MQPAKSTCCVLLTASVDPNGCDYVARSDPAVRERDYIKALLAWIRKASYPVVFCENSGYDLSKIKAAISKERSGHLVEFLQYSGNDYPREIGKSYGELQIIKHALEHSHTISSATYVIKVTGRYFVLNPNRIVSSLGRGSDCYVMADMEQGAHGLKDSVPSTVFVSRPDFLRRYLIPFEEQLYCQRGFAIEQALYFAIQQARKDGFICRQFDTFPIVYGYSGGYGTLFFSSGITRRIKKMLRRIRSLATVRRKSI